MKAIIFMLALILPISASAKQIMVLGIGTASCGSILIALEKNEPSDGFEMNGQYYYTEIAAYSQWVLGYISSYSAIYGIPTKETDLNGVIMWIKKYCEKNPSDMISNASNAFIKAHFKPR